MKYEITANDTFKSIEIAFDGKPSEAVRDALKAMRFRWHSVKKVWYGYKTAEEATEAIENATKGVKVAKTPKTAKVAEKVNKFGVKVGDVFYLNWGWEQTNVAFFHVTAQREESSVKVNHVSPRIVETKGEGFMCATYVYDITKEAMTTDSCAVFLDNGDTKRVQGDAESPYIRLGSHRAYKIPFGLREEYVSWYA